MTAGGEVSGLTYGDRKFNLVGKGNSILINSLLLDGKGKDFC